MPAAKGQRATKRPKITFPADALRYAAILVTRGAHGDNVNEVLRSLVNDGIKQAFRDGLLRESDYPLE